MTLGDVKIQTYQPAHWERGRERELSWWMGYEMYSLGGIFDYTPCRMTWTVGKQRKKDGCGEGDQQDSNATSHTRCILTNLFAPFCVYLLKMTESCGTCWNQGHIWGQSARARMCVTALFLTCGSRAAAAWTWGCRQPASSAGETASRFWSPASGRSSGRSYAPGSPCTRCARTPGSPDKHKEGKKEREGWQTEKRCGQESKKESDLIV